MTLLSFSVALADFTDLKVMEDKPLKVLKRPTPDVESTQGKSVSSVIADVGTAEGKPVKSKKEIPPDVDLSVYEQHRVFPYTKYTKKELKALKVTYS